ARQGLFEKVESQSCVFARRIERPLVVPSDSPRAPAIGRIPRLVGIGQDDEVIPHELAGLLDERNVFLHCGEVRSELDGTPALGTHGLRHARAFFRGARGPLARIGHELAVSSAPQLVQRDLEHLAHQVPERDLDVRTTADAVESSARVEQSAREALYVEWVGTDQSLARGTEQRGRHSRADARQSRIGMDQCDEVAANPIGPSGDGLAEFLDDADALYLHIRDLHPGPAGGSERRNGSGYSCSGHEPGGSRHEASSMHASPDVGVAVFYVVMMMMAGFVLFDYPLARWIVVRQGASHD